MLAQGYREKVRLATKMPSWLVNTRDDMDRFLDTQLERLQTDHIDFYLLHTLNAHHCENYLKLNIFEGAERKMAQGKFRYLGVSFHDSYEVFESILNGYDNWTFCQIQYNYMDINYQAGQRGLHAAADKGLAVVVMEPLRGGRLAKNPPPPRVAEVFRAFRPRLDTCELGAAVGLEPTRSLAAALRNEHDGTGRAKPGSARANPARTA